jgi:hypothetical protein
MTAEEVRGKSPAISVCKKCGGFGFTGVIPLLPYGWLAKDVFELGVPCSCPAGQGFAEMQKEWKKPIPPGRGLG